MEYTANKRIIYMSYKCNFYKIIVVRKDYMAKHWRCVAHKNYGFRGYIRPSFVRAGATGNYRYQIGKQEKAVYYDHK